MEVILDGVGLLQTILKVEQPTIISSKFYSIWFGGFWEDVLNMISFYQNNR
jgi:hypothetical protein